MLVMLGGELDDEDRALAQRAEEAEVGAITASYFARSLHKVISEKQNVVLTEELPLARIKRIMKQDSCEPFPRMISADAVPFMAFAAKLFIGALTTLAWKLSTQRSKRNTLQLKDLKEAASSSSKFDFLIDGKREPFVTS